MIHPDTELKSINKDKGKGIFATAFIPKGTLTYVKDPLEIEIQPDDPLLQDPRIGPIIETYSYTDEKGMRIVSWDHAKYVNHCCHCNTMSTGYGFEIAIRDIRPGEEITDEYGMFNFKDKLILKCPQPQCRGSVNGNDINIYYAQWDQKIKAALQEFEKVPQPLRVLIAPSTLESLAEFLRTGKGYQSVLNLKYERKSLAP